MVGPFAGLDVPWLLAMRAEVRRDHPFLIWAPFDAPARKWTYGEFHDRVGALAAGLVKRGIRQGDYVLIHLDNCIEAMLAWFACVELGAIAVTTNTRSAAAEIEYFAGHCGAVAAITQPAYAELVAANCKGLRWIAVISHDAGAACERRRAATVLNPCSPTAPTARAAPPIRSRPAACNTPPAPRRGRRRCCGPMPMRCGAPRSTPRIRTCTRATCTRPICRCFTPTRWPIRCWRASGSAATCVIQPRFSASRFWPVALEHGCTWTSTIPFCMKALLEHEIPKHHKFRLWGTAVNDPPPFAAFGVKIIGWWGMTETITHGIIGEVDQPNTPMSIGRAAAEYAIRITDDDGAPTAGRRHRQSLDQGRAGPVAVRGISAQRKGHARKL